MAATTPTKSYYTKAKEFLADEYPERFPDTAARLRTERNTAYTAAKEIADKKNADADKRRQEYEDKNLRYEVTKSNIPYVSSEKLKANRTALGYDPNSGGGESKNPANQEESAPAKAQPEDANLPENTNSFHMNP